MMSHMNHLNQSYTNQVHIIQKVMMHAREKRFTFPGYRHTANSKKVVLQKVSNLKQCMMGIAYFEP
jgi:hypothetical protein